MAQATTAPTPHPPLPRPPPLRACSPPAPRPPPPRARRRATPRTRVRQCRPRQPPPRSAPLVGSGRARAAHARRHAYRKEGMQMRGEVRAGTREGVARRRRKRRAGRLPGQQTISAANWPRLAEPGGCPALDLALAGRAVGRSLWAAAFHIEANSIARPTGSSSSGPGSTKVPLKVARPSLSSSCTVTCSRQPVRARAPSMGQACTACVCAWSKALHMHTRTRTHT